MPYYKTCPRCGAHLDPSEVCDCGSNNQRFNQLLNNCAQPRRMYDVLAALAAQEARETFPERFTGKTDQEIINEIANVVKAAQCCEH